MPSQEATENTQIDVNAATEPIVIDNLTTVQLESLFLHTLDESKRIATNDETMSREIAMAKMLSYCIRMLHSHEWVPRTVVRAMVLMEGNTTPNRSVKGFLYQALRERKNESRAHKARKNPNHSAAAELNGDGKHHANGNHGDAAGAEHADVHEEQAGNGVVNGDAGAKSAKTLDHKTPATQD